MADTKRPKYTADIVKSPEQVAAEFKAAQQVLAAKLKEKLPLIMREGCENSRLLKKALLSSGVAFLMRSPEFYAWCVDKVGSEGAEK